MKISYITPYDGKDIKNWSGTAFYIAQSIQRMNIELDYINTGALTRFKADILTRITHKLSGKRYLHDRLPRIAKKTSLLVNEMVAKDSKMLFAPGSHAFSYIKSSKPKVFYTDSTFNSMLGYYSWFTNLSKETIRNGHKLERAALHNCDLAIYSSEWAAESAINYYGADPKKVKVVPFGANIECERGTEDIISLVQNKEGNKCKLLFIGVEWERKGGPLALKVAKLLNKLGLRTELHIVGLDKIPEPHLPDFIINHGFLDKNTTEGLSKIDDLFKSSHFLLVPSLAEAYGIVFCEANSFGLPAISIDTGGISTIIKNNINGKLFEQNIDPALLASYILDVFSNYKDYEQLCYSSFKRYDEVLNWKVSGKLLAKHINSLQFTK